MHASTDRRVLAPVLVLGAGFTGARVARRLLAEGHEVHLTCRDPSRLAGLAAAGAHVHRLDLASAADAAALRARLPEGLRVLHSVPVVEGPAGPGDPTPALLELVAGRAARLVYLSTTGVYGDARVVDETTPVGAPTPRTRPRLEAERLVLGAGPSALVLRPAAIYGPGRGVHVALREGRHRVVGDGTNFISRIHVDDLAALSVAALRSDETGAFPVADDEPARSGEVAAFCAALLGLPPPPSVPPEAAAETLRADRRVDGRAIRARLGVTLAHPSYRVGIPACLAAEGQGVSG